MSSCGGGGVVVVVEAVEMEMEVEVVRRSKSWFSNVGFGESVSYLRSQCTYDVDI